jgi:hypothetical protein
MTKYRRVIVTKNIKRAYTNKTEYFLAEIYCLFSAVVVITEGEIL